MVDVIVEDTWPHASMDVDVLRHKHMCMHHTHYIALRTNLLNALCIPCGGGAHHLVRLSSDQSLHSCCVRLSLEEFLAGKLKKQNLIQCSGLKSSTDQTYRVFYFSPLALLRTLHSFLSLVKCGQLR